MKRDMDLVRAILFAVEDAPVGGMDAAALTQRLEAAGHTPSEPELGEHCDLLCEAGLIVALTASCLGQSASLVEVNRLTWDGHEFLGVARDETVWKKVKAVAGSASLAVLKPLLTEATKQLLAGQL